MKVIDPGHHYILEDFDNPNEGEGQELKFIKKAPRSEGSTEMVTVQEGTTNEEVLAVLIDRMYNLQNKFPCKENAIVITKLEESLMWLNKRTSGRQKRGVEGQHKA